MIFISYAHADNQPFTKEQKGWVELLHERLDIRVKQLIGKRQDIPIWRDKKLQGNDDFGAEIITQLERARIMVSILSPSYVTSEWCLKELNLFCCSAEAHHTSRMNKSQVFKVIKTPLPIEQHPRRLQGLLGYEFYEILDKEKGKAKEFVADPQPDTKYLERLNDLAYDIKFLAETLGANIAAPPSNKDAVYLALTTSDIAEEREKVKRELQQHGFVVFPDQDLMLTAGGFQKAVREYLERSRLSVHLIGKHYGIVPEGEVRSIVRLQLDLAMERNHGFSRLVWLPPALEPEDDRQQGFIEQLRNAADPEKGLELVQTKLEDLKTLVQIRLRSPQPSTQAQSAVTDESPPRLYLICDRQDDESVNPLVDHLFKEGLEVIRQFREGEQEQLLEMDREDRRLCDAILIYCDRPSDFWMQLKLREMMKLANDRRDRPLLVKPLYLLAGQKTAAKEQFRTHEGEVIRMFDAFDPSLLAPFIAYIKDAKGGRR